jgi:Tol biopolymer transport system component
MRFGPTGDYEGVFVMNVNGTGLKQILPPTMQANCCSFDWSPQGNDIVFSRHVTPDVHSSLWIVHSDGTGLRQVNVQPSSACGAPNADPSAEGCVQPGWSPDGTKIAFAKGHSTDVDAAIYTVNVDGTGLTKVSSGGVTERQTGARTRRQGKQHLHEPWTAGGSGIEPPASLRVRQRGGTIRSRRRSRAPPHIADGEER